MIPNRDKCEVKSKVVKAKFRRTKTMALSCSKKTISISKRNYIKKMYSRKD